MGSIMMSGIKKMEGFREQRLFVLPEYLQRELGSAELTRTLFVSDIGFFPHAKHHYRERPEGTDAHIFIYCIEGEGTVEKEGSGSSDITAGSLAVIPSGTPHRYWASENRPWSIYWFHLKGQHAGELTRLYGMDAGPVKLPRGSVTNFIAGIDQSIAILQDRPYSIPVHVHVAQTLRHLLSGIGLELTRNSNERKRDQHLDNAIRYMTEHVSTSIRLSELAKHTGLSAQHIIHLFNKETGFSPIDYFLRMKMQHAANMLDLTGLNVKEVANAIGIADPYYFSRMFKKLMGHSPRDYRKIQKG